MGVCGVEAYWLEGCCCGVRWSSEHTLRVKGVAAAPSPAIVPLTSPLMGLIGRPALLAGRGARELWGERAPRPVLKALEEVVYDWLEEAGTLAVRVMVPGTALVARGVT